ncbi:MAG: type I DNA topoisomerase [Proteobacteria bacterium]|nr:type I DNA topoisomerase [Pseudomonadota bacterium]
MEKQYLVIVESPTKAKTIRKFLPKNFVVEASVGHIRDLPQSAADTPLKYKKEPWARLGINVDQNFEPLYIIPKDKAKIIAVLKEKLKDADELFLATDEDREGESISWHLTEILKPKTPVKRMVFHEITKSAIEAALKNTRKVDEKLVRAQETRRILDRLVGFTVSPVLWKKVAFGLSAGRVQSVALRLMVERERQRMRFKRAGYWDISAELGFDAKTFDARLLSIGEKRVAQGKDFDETTGQLKEDKDMLVLDEKSTVALVARIKSADWSVTSIEEKQSNSKPSPPFITSTLQQEGSRKLHLSTRDVMRTAQSLYEQGFITYMRTDSPNLSQDALSEARASVEKIYGKSFLSDAPRQFAAKSKGAQEAHEAIRPAGGFTPPDNTGLSGKDLELYTLIWRRTLASQMAEAQKSSMSVRIGVADATFSATGTKIVFPGFLKAYDETLEVGDASWGTETLLPALKKGDKLKLTEAVPQSHETKPPARFTEASIVQAMEKAGIGRPSTYASVISTLLDRKYVLRNSGALVPTFTGFAVTQLLERHFDHLVDLEFTSKMEESLDEIAEGQLDHLKYLKEFYLGAKGLKEITELKEKQIGPKEGRSITIPQLNGELEVRIGRFGPYLAKIDEKDEDSGVFASIPDDIAPADLDLATSLNIIAAKAAGPQSIGKYPESGEDIFVMLGKYGAYLQVGKVSEDKKAPKPRRASIPRDKDVKEISIEEALKYLSLPRELGKNPESKDIVTVFDGRFGPYIKSGSDMRSLKKTDDKYTITFERAIELLKEEKKGRFGAKMLKDLGNHPNGKSIGIFEGKFGPYVKVGTVSVSLPKESDPNEFTVDQAVALVATKLAAEGPDKTKKPAKKKAEAKMSSKNDDEFPLKKTAKKPAPKSKEPVVGDVGTPIAPKLKKAVGGLPKS